MSFGTNLQFMRKMHNSMTQEELAEKMSVSRQTISKWEMDSAFPEMEKAIALCNLFNCSLDELLRGDMNSGDAAYSNIRIEKVKGFSYIKYAVISVEPEDDANTHIRSFAEQNGISDPEIIGWDFPYLSQEQTNVFHMHGYCAACIIPENINLDSKNIEVQPEWTYVAITIENPFCNPFVLIPNAYKTLFRYIDVNKLKHGRITEAIECFEKVYSKNGIEYMDVYIAINK